MKEAQEISSKTEQDSSQEIILICGNTTIGVDPNGAMIRSFKVGDKDILFPDQIIETDKGQKRRGGIPMLWPQAGSLTLDSDEFKLPPTRICPRPSMGSRECC